MWRLPRLSTLRRALNVQLSALQAQNHVEAFVERRAVLLNRRFRRDANGSKPITRALLPRSCSVLLKGGKGLFIKSQTRPIHANEGNQATRKGTSP